MKIQTINLFIKRHGGILYAIESALIIIIQRILPYNLYLFLYSFDSWYRTYVVKKILDKIDKNKKKKIIDIGGGWGNLERSLKRKDIAIYEPNDEFIDIAKKYSNLVIKGYGEKINIDDNTFDLAISIHTLEHIPKQNRKKFLNEMTRIANEYIILFNPYGDYSHKLCLEIKKFCEKRGIEISPFTLEHLQCGLPEIHEIQSIMKSYRSWEMLELRDTQNYYTDKLFFFLWYSKIPFLKLIFLPILSIFAFTFKDIKPNTCLVIIYKKIK